MHTRLVCIGDYVIREPCSSTELLGAVQVRRAPGPSRRLRFTTWLARLQQSPRRIPSGSRSLRSTLRMHRLWEVGDSGTPASSKEPQPTGQAQQAQPAQPAQPTRRAAPAWPVRGTM